MTPETERMPPMFVGEHTALDFLNSIAAPKGTMIDWLDTKASLLDWFERSRLCDAAELEQLQSHAQADAFAQTLGEIHQFRDAFRDFIHATAGRSQPPVDHPMIARLNALLRSSPLQMQIAPAPSEHGQTLVLNTQYPLHQPRDLLTRLAQSCAALICEADFTYIRNCEGPTCTLFFLDISKNHKRRWCSMKVCGNRAKATAHRRAKAASSPA